MREWIKPIVEVLDISETLGGGSEHIGDGTWVNVPTYGDVQLGSS